MAAPAVRDLQNLISEYSAAFDPQRQLIDADIAANANAGAAQEAGLAAKRQTAFKDVEQRAQNKGLFFSGFSPNEQATYDSGTYMPALANLQATIAATRSNLLGKRADLDTSARNSALGARENDLTALNNYNTQQEQIAAQERAAAIDRQFKAEQAALERKAAASLASSKSGSKDISGIVNSIGSFLQSKVGKDGKVSPATFQQGRQQWIAQGGSGDSYAQAFYGFVNQKHAGDYF